MELQDTRFTRFMLNSWIDYQKFKGASRICALFLNFLFLIIKLLSCGLILIVCAPHLSANHLLNKQEQSVFKTGLYVLSVLLGLVIDIPLLLVCAASVFVTIQFILDCQFVEATVCGVVSWVLIKIELILLTSLFYKAPKKEEEQDDTEQEEEVVDKSTEEVENEELPFCQLFNLSKDTCLMIDHVEMCPDETAFIRVVDEEGYTALYKRRVKRSRVGDRYIIFNGENYYLDDKKTQPIIPKK